MPDSKGNAIDVGCVVNVLPHEHRGMKVPGFRGIVSAHGRDKHGVYVSVAVRRHGERLARPDTIVVVRGIPPEDIPRHD